MEIYRIQDLSFKYPLSQKENLKNISLDIRQGEFLTICGKSGSGKSSLIRQLKPSLSPHGVRTGLIEFKGRNIEDLSRREDASQIGYILQNPDNQIVTDKVWHELAFGLESLGFDNKDIRLKVAEMASYFGIHNWFNKKTSDLSGGQKQLLNLASTMVMQPAVLILDEPTSQLDPIAASDFINTLKQINKDLGVTVIITEHRLEEIIPVSDRLAVLDNGKLIALDRPELIGKQLYELGHPMFKSMPTASQIYGLLGYKGEFPLTVNQGRLFVENKLKNKNILSKKKVTRAELDKEIILEAEELWFRYDKKSKDILKNLSLKVRKGQILSILGGNGTGKSTLLKLMAGLEKPYRGRIMLRGKNINKISYEDRYKENLGVLPQDPQSLFVKEVVEEDLYEMFPKKLRTNSKDRIEEVLKLVELENLRHMHPYDLSGGEQQRLALAKILLLEPDILLLDEPTKGMDNFFKDKFAQILNKLKKQGKTIVIISHDIEFCARYSDRSAMLFNGQIITENTTRDFFAGNSFYTTSANKIIRHIFPEAITTEDVINLWPSLIEKE